MSDSSKRKERVPNPMLLVPHSPSDAEVCLLLHWLLSGVPMHRADEDVIWFEATHRKLFVTAQEKKEEAKKRYERFLEKKAKERRDKHGAALGTSETGGGAVTAQDAIRGANARSDEGFIWFEATHLKLL